MTEHRDRLEAELDSASTDELKKLIRALEDASECYVARRMDSSVRQVLAGKQIDEVDV